MSGDQAAAILSEVRALREDVSEVKQLAAKTNGRVRALEIWRAKVEGAWAATSALGGRVYLLGAGLAGTIVGGVAVAVILRHI